MEYFWVAAAIIVIAIVFVLLLHHSVRSAHKRHERAQIRRAGQDGEVAAFHRIREIAAPGDHICTNVCVSFEGRETELDNVIVNRFGVFIIEVKNYSGRIRGGEGDRRWSKTHRSRSGIAYTKDVDNPIRQVKRQTFILARFLRENGYTVWVKGYAYLLNENSPVKSKYLLSGIHDIERTIHSGKTEQMLDEKTVQGLTALLRAAEQTEIRDA